MGLPSNHLLIILIAALGLCACEQTSAGNLQQTQPIEPPHTVGSTSRSKTITDNTAIEQAFASKQSNIQATGTGTVIKLLADDNKGAKHQRFLVKINVKQTLLFAHNIDLAPRVPLQVGDTISFNGEYVYNPKGGVIHWTHHAPKGDHEAGWILLHQQKYQ